MDEKRLWMAKEVSRWMQEGLIEEAKGNVLLQQYKKYGNTKVAIARMMGAAAFCFFLAGTVLLITSFWAGLTQAGQFWWALAPLLLSFCLWASISLMKNPGIILRETAGVFYGISLYAAIGLIHESYEMSPDIYQLALWGALFLIPAAYLLQSAGAGVLVVLGACAVPFLAPIDGWTDVIPWVLMAMIFPLLFLFLKDQRTRQTLAFSWVWTGGAVGLISISVSEMIWRLLFCSVMAALSVMGGVYFSRFVMLADSMKKGGIFFLGLIFLVSGSGQFWREMTFPWYLIILGAVLLAVVSAVSWIMVHKKEYAVSMAGTAPWIMAAAAAVYAGSGAAGAAVGILSAAGLGGAAFLFIKSTIMGQSAAAAGSVLWIILWAALRLFDNSFSYFDRGLYFLGAGVMLSVLAAVVLWIRYKEEHTLHDKRRGSL